MNIDIAATLDKLQQIATAPKNLSGTDSDKRRVLQRYCDEANLTPVYEGDADE